MKIEVQTELEAIYDREGALNPEAVVEAARDEKTALHAQFQWNDSLAAHQHRLLQARQLIRVAVTVIPALSNSPVKQFVSISALRGSQQGSYVAVVDLLSDAAKYELAKQDAFRALELLKGRFEHIVELGDVWNALDKALAKAKREDRKAA